MSKWKIIRSFNKKLGELLFLPSVVGLFVFATAVACELPSAAGFGIATFFIVLMGQTISMIVEASK